MPRFSLEHGVSNVSNSLRGEGMQIQPAATSKVRPTKLSLGSSGLKVTSKLPPMAGQAGCLQGQDRSAVTTQAAYNLDIA
ncbi:hypothetical protein J6590_004390 [Homalodisca vitripennis]|nr:hypothetical protein J6590_004390 [Homalodisca vitripennis]